MSISHFELMKIRRRHKEQEEEQQLQKGKNEPPSFGPPSRHSNIHIPSSNTSHNTQTTLIYTHPSLEISLGTTLATKTPLKTVSAADSGYTTARSVEAQSKEPKVFAPFVTLQGCVPKEELVSRRIKAFQWVSIEKALLECGIDYYRNGIDGCTLNSDPPEHHGHGLDSYKSQYHRMLPLEGFDDYEYDEYTPEDWMQIGKQDGGLPCECVVEIDGRGKWVRGIVTDWDIDNQRLLVVINGNLSGNDFEKRVGGGTGDYGSDGKMKVWMPRVHVHLDAEDPNRFVSRVVAAHRKRDMAVANLRYNMYIKNMPIDNSQNIGNFVFRRIKDLAFNTEALRRNQFKLDVDSLLEEINADFADATNMEIFLNVNARGGTTSGTSHFPNSNSASFIKDKSDTESHTKVFGQVQLQENNFGDVVRAFHSSTYLNNQDEVHKAIQLIQNECDNIVKIYVFVTYRDFSSKPMLLDDFEELQNNNIHSQVQELKDSWCTVIKDHVLASLKHTNSENEVNLNITSKDEYEGSKLKRFMTMIKFMMQDCLFHIITSSLENYVLFIEKCCNFCVFIDGMADVEVSNNGQLTVYPQEMGRDIHPPVPEEHNVKTHTIPLFKVVLKEVTIDSEDDKAQSGKEANISTDQGKSLSAVEYHTHPDHFINAVIGVFNKGIVSLQEIPQVDGWILPNIIYHAQPPMIASISMTHQWSQEWRERLTVAMDYATKPLRDYINTYDSLRDLVILDITTYIAECEKNIGNLKEFQREVQKHIDRKREVESTIPANVNLGTFFVDCVDFRNRMIVKCDTLAQKTLELMAKRSRTKAEEVDEKFSEIRATLIRPLETLEDCVSTKEFIKTIPVQVYDLNILINEMSDIHDALETFEFPLCDDDFAKKWRAVGWPVRLENSITQRHEDIKQVKINLTEVTENKQALFEKEIEDLQNVIDGFYKYCDIKKTSEITAEVRDIMAHIQKSREQANLFNFHEGLLEREKTDYSHVHTLTKDFEPYSVLWLTTNDWLQWQSEWNINPFDTIDAEVMSNNVLQSLKNMQKCSRDPKFKDKAPILKIIDDITCQIDNIKPILPLVRYLRTDGMKDYHWSRLSQEIGFEVKPGVTLLTLQDIYSMDLKPHEKTIMNVSEIASCENEIEKNLASMKKEWEDVRLRVKSYKSTGSYIMPKETVDETQEILDNQLLTTQALSFSPFKKIFEAEIDEWDKNLKLVQAIMDEWKITQKAWMYLEPIFQSEDITRQLPAENKRFQTVNKNWKQLTNKAHTVDLVMPFCTKTENCLKICLENNELLEKIQKGLNQYLENKRSSFARFYFLSDDELLTILSEAKDPQKIQPHFRKIFENIARIEMVSPTNEMFGMYSHMDEYIPFREPLLPCKNIENWLSDIETMMKRSIRQELENGMQIALTKDHSELVLTAPGQVAIAINQVMWTAKCERHLNEDGSLKNFVPTANKNLMSLVETVRKVLTPLQQMNLGAMITIEVHARDIVEKLTEEKVPDIYAFEWVSQLRSYWENNDCYLRQVEAQFKYGGESLGNTTRLVITPLTDRIYLTLTGAMHMFLGSAPAGPAGTGKTETVKDLAKAIAKQCVVFNCQEGMTYASMGKFFKGLANAGAWACFDEFNRIDVEVLSVVAQQVSSLQEAARSGQYRIAFEGTEILVDPSYSVFITMNPGYAGRTELPDNLKVLFRPVACMVPDYAMIAEIRLFSFGYSDSRKLSQKMVATFRLSSEQLSLQDHYDFGMRAVNTVISAAGLMKRENPDQEEDVLLLRALRDSNAPKFLKEDLLLFNGIISDLFPSVVVPISDYGKFQTVLEEKCVTNKLQATPLFVKKCIEVFEMSVLRHGQMSVGPTMGGKTSVTKVLKEAMTALKQEHNEDRFAVVETYELNPKSITMSQLYGGFDEATGEWRDGLIAELFRIAARQTNKSRQWIIFDGPVDALWIESMNTVLDDNKKLCLISGEIITMSTYMSCMFEVEDLAVASPATVSRAGMIYMEPLTCIGVESFIRSWQMHTLPSTFEPYKQNLQKICELLFTPLIHFVQTSVSEYSPTVWPNLIKSCFNIFGTFLHPFTPTKTQEVPPEKLELLCEVHLPLLVFSIVWSFGVTGDNNSRKKFDKFIRDELQKHSVQVLLPDFGLLHDYEFIMEEKRWVNWSDRAPSFTTSVTAANIADIIVPTADVVKYKYITKLLLSNSIHTLCIGPTGTGKSVLISELLFTGMSDEFIPIFFSFSAQTSANQTQDLISSKFEARRRASPQIWGAPINKKFLVFVDDLNMPIKEQYGAQPPIELLRQFTDYKGWYDRKTREFFYIVDVVLISAMGPPGGGRNKVTNRLLRHFNQIAFPDIDDDNMKVIFSSILGSYFNNAFSDDVRSKLTTVVESTIDVYNTVIKELRPTPSRPHYLFNLRDVSKVIGGLLSAQPKLVKDEKSLVKLYLHESSRTFRDRLVDVADRGWFDNLLNKEIQKHFNLKWSDVVSNERLLFVDFLKMDEDERHYDEVKDLSTLVQVCYKFLENYNNIHRNQMNLVMFLDAVEHVSRAVRVLTKPAGHLLLLGIGGSGRQSLARLAAFISELDTHQVEIMKGYSMSTWKEDVKVILRKASFNNKQLLFLITDTQIVHEGMLEDVNNLLNSGEIPNLFVGPDVDEIMTAMKPICVTEGIHLDKVNMYARFVKFCKKNLRVALCMSPMGEPFRNRLRMFPAIVNCCTIDWFAPWPDQALESVAENFLSGIEALHGNSELFQNCVSMCVHIHQSVEKMSERFLLETRRHNYVTPTSYQELLRCFKDIMTSETMKTQTHKTRLMNGLEKLRHTEIQISELQQTLAESQPILAEKQASIEKMVEEMVVETAKAEETRQSAAAEQKVASEKQQECAGFEAETKAILDEALPALDKALASLANLQPQQLNEVASYKVPTSGVRLTVQGLCILFQVKLVMKVPEGASLGAKKEPDYWQTAKESLFTNMATLMANMKNFHKNVIPTISEKTINMVGPLIQDPAFDPETVRKTASVACVAMCEWAHAMHKYFFVNKQVQPLRKALEAAQADSKISEEKLAVAQARLQEVEDRLAKLQKAKNHAESEMKELEETVQNTEIKLKRAAMLIDGLAGEKKNWNSTIAMLTEREKYLTGDMLCAAGQISYVGAFTSVYRHDLLVNWQEKLGKLNIQHSPKCSVYNTMQDPVQSRQWAINSLPTDILSIENALILTKARRWPLMIDPQMQANRWIRDTYGDTLEVMSPSTANFIKKIEMCIRSGRPALLENVSDDINPALDPLLVQQTFIEGGTEMIRITENSVPWNKNFKFFMTTKLANPHYIPEVMVKVTLLNFFITPVGLEDQLLGVLVGRERKELEDQKVYFVQQNASMKAQIDGIQTTILRKLQEVTGDILEDEELINYLNQSKVTTAEIAEKVEQTEITEREIDQTREGYRSMATHSTILYFCCAQLANVDPMYQYSLQWFVQLFISSIDSAETSDDLETRLQILKDYFTYSFYQNISRSLFEKHKLMFSFILCIRILQGSDKVDAGEYNFLLRGIADEPSNIPPNPASDWITSVTWKELYYLDSNFSFFNGLTKSIKDQISHFREIFLSASAHRAKMPGDWDTRLTPMQKMMFIRCLRPDKLMDAIQDFVSSIMGERFIKPPQFDLETSFKDSTSHTPLIFILSPGADPFEEWKKFADKQRMSKKLSDISLGQGQGPRAERLFREGMDNGMWVLLQNCHLATSWMPTLERLVESITPAVNPQFRLWLTSMPNPHFPVAILQNGVKMTNEPPKGMRANVTRSILSFSDSMMERSKKPDVYRKLAFSMCFFHALIQERRKFGALGWNIPYEYTSGDLNCCVQQIGMFLDKYDDVPYKVIRELSGQIHYGGRVTDDWDRRLITTILEVFMKPEVLDDNYAFSPSRNFMSVRASDQKSLLEYVDTWPNNVAPEVFGFHENADITCARNETFDTLATIVILQGADGETSVKSSSDTVVKTPDDHVTELAASILSRIRPPFDIAAYQAKYPTKYEDSMSTVLVQEAIRFNRLLTTLRSSLQSVQLAIKGLIVMSKDLEDVYHALFNNMVPQMWAEKAYPSLKPLAGWVSDLACRLEMIVKWYEKGHPKAYWISGFYFPQAFLTGILQNYAREKQISIDKISYGFEWLKGKTLDAITEAPSAGCYIYGMLIEGARIDEKTMKLAESLPKVLFEGTPVLWLIPVVDRPQNIQDVYKCPMYKTLRRSGTLSTTGHSTNYILSVEIDTPKELDSKHWIKRGVAMVCALND